MAKYLLCLGDRSRCRAKTEQFDSVLDDEQENHASFNDDRNKWSSQPASPKTPLFKSRRWLRASLKHHQHKEKA